MKKKETLLKEQNKSLFMISGIVIVAIAVLGIAALIFFNATGASTGNTNSLIDDNGVVNDLPVYE